MVNTVSIMREFVANSNNQDSGREGKAFEIAIRSYIMGRGVKSVKQQGKTDIRFTLDGKRYNCEIKSACGELDGTEKAQFIIYCPTVDVDFPAEIQSYVFSREQWQAFLTGYAGRGKFLRYDSKRGSYHIQSFYVSETIRPKASKAIAGYIQTVLFDMPTVEEFFGRG